ncbi:MAG: FKBP-type peptidyl-prolyl cis-trans isomerase [Prevotellaceae bacterium]|nr:FKBP-type peptidyl-prolyl cis-trans isomerase [Candidatus Minthosoma caballi]
MKRILYILSFLTFSFSLLTFTTSCSESEEASEYDNWQERNQHYVDSISALAINGVDGWSRMLAYNLSDSELFMPNNNQCIYIKKIAKGTGTVKPLSYDYVRVHYLGRLISSSTHPQGFVFDKSYKDYTLNEATDVPSLFQPYSTVVGFGTAMMNMVEGDHWKVVIPYYLGYGESSNNSSIPAYSTLIFDIKVARIYPFKADVNTDWY